MVVRVRMFVCLCVAFKIVLAAAQKQSRTCLMRQWSVVVGTKPGLAAVGSATVAVLSQSSGIERPFFAMRRSHVVYNNCALYMLYKQQCRGFYCCSKRVVNARSVF